MPALTLLNLTKAIGLNPPPTGAEKVVSGVAPLEAAGPGQVSFLDNPKYRASVKETKAAAVFIRLNESQLLPPGCIALICANPYAAMARALHAFHPAPGVVPGISKQAVVSDSATIHPTARIEPGVVVYANASVGEGAHIGANTVIGEGCKVGAHTRIGSGCTLQKTTVGERCLIHPGVRTGQDGFGFAVEGEQLVKVPQIGGVVIGNDVEIGANTTIDCGALGDTVLEDMVKLDNQIQIGHNAIIGKGTRIVAQSAVAGSTTIGKFNLIGGQVGVAGHITTADKVMVAARSGISKSITQVGAILGGAPAVPLNEWRRQVAIVARLAKKGLPGSKPATDENDTDQ
jgi:UDP-3-O-[3-hydroxymyristoyl] glucosamine N-acyltransferase